MKTLIRLLSILIIFTSVSFSQGLEKRESAQPFPVEQNGKWGYIDKADRLVITAQYDYVSDFCDGKAQVKMDDKTFTINKSGEVLDAS